MMQDERAEGNRNTALKIILNPFLSTRSLCLTANAGRDATESGTRDDRIWDEARPNLGRDATESGARRDRTWEEARLNAGRRSLTGIDRGLAGRLVCKPIVFAKSGRFPHHSLIVNTPKYSIAFHILQYGLHGMLTVFLLIKHQNQCCQISKQIISASRTIYHKKALTLWQNIKL